MSMSAYVQRVPFRGMGHLFSQAALVGADWKFLQKHVKDLTDSQKGGHILAMMGSGAIQVLRPSIEAYIARGLGTITNNRLGENFTKRMFDAVPLVLLLGAAYFTGTSMKADTIASLCLRALGQLGIEKAFYPDIVTNIVTNIVTTPGPTQYVDKEVEKEVEVNTWNLPSFTVSESNVDSLRGLDSKGIVQAQRVETQASLVEFWKGLPISAIKSWQMPEGLTLERYATTLRDKNADKDPLAILNVPGQELVIDLKDKEPKDIQKFMVWWGEWSGQSNDIQRLVVKGATTEQLTELFQLNSEDGFEALNKVRVLKLEGCEFTKAGLAQIKKKNPSICAFDLRGSTYNTSGVHVSPSEDLPGALAKMGFEIAPKCIVINPDGKNNILDSLHEFHVKLIIAVYNHRNSQGASDQSQDLSKVKDLFDPNLFPIIPFIKEVNFLRGLYIYAGWTQIMKKLQENFTSAVSFDFTASNIYFKHIKRLFEVMKPNRVILRNCRFAFIEWGGHTNNTAKPKTEMEVFGVLNRWASAKAGQIYLDIENALLFSEELAYDAFSDAKGLLAKLYQQGYERLIQGLIDTHYALEESTPLQLIYTKYSMESNSLKGERRSFPKSTPASDLENE